MLPNSIQDIRGGSSNPYEFRISFLKGSHNVESTLLWIDKIDKLFVMEYIPMENQVEFVAYKVKGKTVAW